MANAVDSLFDSVLAGLSPGSENNVPDWQDSDDLKDDHEFDPSDKLRGSEDDRLMSMDEDSENRRVTDQLHDRRVSEMNPEESDAVEGGIRHLGFEAIAFYKSRRMRSQRPFSGKWGIFYLKDGLTYIESQIVLDYPGYGNPRKLAHEFLREHERFHYRADMQTLMFEATLGRHLYLPLRRALREKRSHFVEEALANRQVWDWSKKSSVGLQELAFDFMKLQPNAYARFDEPRLTLAAEWAANVVNQLPPGSPGRMDLAHWVDATPTGLTRLSLCPEYVVFPARLTSWLDPALVPPPVNQVDDGDEVVKVLSTRYAQLRGQWETTKRKLLENRLLRGLNFKPWSKDGPGRYSVRVDENFRAHLKHEGNGHWTAYKFGPHTRLGHG